MSFTAPPWDPVPEDKIAIDDLFEKAHRTQDARNNTYNKVLARVHRTIRTTSRVRSEDRFCYYSFPEVLIGCPMYDKQACVEYVLDKLESNGFRAVFVHPSMLVISWKHWINDRQRAEIYSKTGLRVDGMGNIKGKKQPQPVTLGSALMALGKTEPSVFPAGGAVGGVTATGVEDYKPLGIYEGLGVGSRLGSRS
jgi:hypothetical protein